MQSSFPSPCGWSLVSPIRLLRNQHTCLAKNSKKKCGYVLIRNRTSFFFILFFFWCFYWTTFVVWQYYSSRLVTMLSLVLWNTLTKVLLNNFTTTLSYHFKFLHISSTINFSILFSPLQRNAFLNLVKLYLHFSTKSRKIVRQNITLTRILRNSTK